MFLNYVLAVTVIVTIIGQQHLNLRLSTCARLTADHLVTW